MRTDVTNRAGGWLVGGVLLLALAAGGCGDDKKRPQGPSGPSGPSGSTGAAEAGGPAKAGGGEAVADAALEESLADTYIYSPVGKRDPFKSFYKDEKGAEKAHDGPVGPLQRYEIDQLELVAVVSGIAQPRAMVTAPDGKGYAVRLGTRIGKNYGRVTRIKNSEIIIAEDYRDPNGRKVTNYIHMSLEKDEEKR